MKPGGGSASVCCPVRARWAVWAACGVALVGLMAVINVLEHPSPDRPASTPFLKLLPMGLLMLAGAVCLTAVAVGPRRRMNRWAMAMAFFVAVAMRAPLWTSPPRSNADYNRYFWDGAVTARGISPYRYAPRQVALGQVADVRLLALANDHRPALERINHPHLRTIYPPLAQGLFAAAHWIAPFDVMAWRAVLLVADALIVLVLLSILRSHNLPRMLLTAYLWNPLVVWETYVGGHADLAAACLALVGVWLLCQQRFVLSAGMLVLAAGVKLWPIVLLPLVLAPLWGRWRRLATVAAVAAGSLVVLGILFAPALGPDSGLGAYSQTWYANPGVFWPVRWAAYWACDWPGGWVTARWLARAVLGLALAVASLLLARRAGTEVTRLGRRAATIVLLMLLLSPTVYPWYYLAVVPLAALNPSPVLLGWTVLLPLCYWPVQEHLAPGRLVLIHVPIWCGLIGSWVWARRKQVS